MLYKKYFKRIIDITISLQLLIILLPIFCIISILIKLDSEGSVFFTQTRLGKGARKFNLYKFRSMTSIERKSSKQTYINSDGVTNIGAFLRRFKIDELPQLINVIKGDMSLIGPRPFLPSSLQEFNDDAHVRLLVKPGLSGLAQVSGNIYLNWRDRWEYDRQYVENLSFTSDFYIMIKTIAVILFGDSVFKKDKLEK